MSTTSHRMLIACACAFLLSSTLVACAVFAALTRAANSGADPRGSDQQAERAAMAVVRPYYRAVEEIGADGGTHPQSIRRFVTEVHGSQLAVAFGGMHAAGLKTFGKSIIVGDELIGRRTTATTDVAEVGVRVCLDVSHTRVVGPAGDEQPSSRRVGRVPYDVWLTTSGGVGNQLRIESTRMREELAPC